MNQPRTARPAPPPRRDRHTLPALPRAAAGAAALLVAGLISAGFSQRYPAHTIRLTAGQAWVPSNQVGELTLLDGATAQVANRIKVAHPGDSLTTAQDGATGYAIDSATGSVTRVDGATATLTQSTILPRDPRGGAATVQIAEDGTLNILNGSPPQLTVADATTLQPHGTPIPLPSRASIGTAAMDPTGKLWALDPDTGDLFQYTHQQHGNRAVAQKAPHATLALAGSSPVLLDPTTGQAERLDPQTAATATTINTPPSPGEQPLITSPDQDHIDVTLSPQGLLLDCSFITHSCTNPTHLEPAQLGPAVKTDNRILVPDYTHGRVWITDQKSTQVIHANIFNHPQHFDLLVRDHIIFYNDPDSEQAGIVNLDATIQRIRKYDPPHAAHNTAPAGTKHQSQHANQHQQSTPRQAPPTNGTRPATGYAGELHIAATPGQEGTIGEQFRFAVETLDGLDITDARWSFGDGSTGTGITATHTWLQPGTYHVQVTARLTNGNTRKTTITITIARSAPQLTIKGITISPPTPTAGQQLTFTADIIGGTPDNWAWSITRTDAGTLETTATTPRFTHTFTDPGDYQATLHVTRNEASAEYSAAFTVTPIKPTLACGDTVTESVTLNVDLDCTGAGLTITADNITLNLGGHIITGGNIAIGDPTVSPEFVRRHDIVVKNGTVIEGFVIFGANNIMLDHLQIGAGGIQVSAHKSVLVSNTTVTDADIGNRNDPRFGGTVKISDSKIVRCRLQVVFSSFDIEHSQISDSSISSAHQGGDKIQGSVLTGTTVIFATDNSSETLVGNMISQGSSVNIEFPGVQATVTDNMFTNNKTALTIEVIDPRDSIVTRNTFRNNGVAGLLLEGPTQCGPCAGALEVSDNQFIGNGNDAGGLIDSRGSSINDGLHADLSVPGVVTISDNITRDNADYGIEARPGTVIDGGGNTSTNNGNHDGCLGVACN